MFDAVAIGWAQTYGGGLIEGAMDKEAHVKEKSTSGDYLRSSLPAEAQTAALRALDLSTLTHMPSVQLIVETAPFDWKAIKGVKGRNSGSKAECYAEVYAGLNHYRYAPLPGKSLQTNFLFRRFTGSAIASTASGRGGSKLQIFPARNAAEVAPALTELANAYGANFAEFATSGIKR